MSDSIHDRSMPDSLPISSLNASSIDTGKHCSNTSLSKIRSEETIYTHDTFDKCVRNISDNCVISLPLKHISTCKLKEKVIDNSSAEISKRSAAASFLDDNDPFKQSNELMGCSSKVDKKCFLSTEPNHSSAAEKLCSNVALGSSPIIINGDINEYSFSNDEVQQILEKSFNTEVNSLQCYEISHKNLPKNLNGLKDNICSKHCTKSPDLATSSSEGSNTFKNDIKPFTNDASAETTSHVSHDKQSIEIASPLNFSKKCLHFPNNNFSLTDSKNRTEKSMKTITQQSNLTTLENCNAGKISSSNNVEISENEVDLVLSHELNGNGCRSPSKLITNHLEINNLDDHRECTMSCRIDGAINQSYSRDNQLNIIEIKPGPDEYDQLYENRAHTSEGSLKSLKSKAVTNDSLICTNSAHSSEHILSNPNKNMCNVSVCELPVLKDTIIYENCTTMEEITSSGDSMILETAERNHHCVANFCIICEKEVENLYYHAAKFHSCFAFVPVKYMRNYQQHLADRSPNINENYVQSLIGDEMYICRTCCLLLPSIESVRVHLNMHSRIYAVLCSHGNCSHCKLTVIYNVKYISSLLYNSSHECFLCHQVTSCQLSLYKHLKIVHFNDDLCHKCSKVVGEPFSAVLEHNISHSDYSKSSDLEAISTDYCQYSWNVLYNSLNSLDGKDYQLCLKNNTSYDRSFKFPIKINVLAEDATAIISPSNFMKKYVDSKFMWKRNLYPISSYAALSFDVYIQVMLSKKLQSIKKNKVTCKKPPNVLTSLGLKQLCRSSKRKSGIAGNGSDVNKCVNQYTNMSSSLSVSIDNAENVVNSKETRAFEAVSDVEISGEWSNSHIFLCCSCGISFDCLTAIMDHKWHAHPGVWCAHTMLRGSEEVPLMFSQQYLPTTSRPIVKNDLYEFNSNVKTINVKCTKCKRNVSLTKFCSHAVECGDLNQITVKKKCRKTARLQSHKGQRMSSRYAIPVRNSYKNNEEDTKNSSSDILSNGWKDSKQGTSASKVKKTKVALHKSQIKHTNKTAVIKSKKSKKISNPKSRKFKMKLRHAIGKKSRTSFKNDVPNIKRKNDPKANLKSKITGTKLLKKINRAESSSQTKKSAAILKKKAIALKKVKRNQKIKNIVASLNVLCKSTSRNVSKNMKVKNNSIKIGRQTNAVSFLEKSITDYEDNVSDHEIKTKIHAENRREGLRVRQGKIKKTRYSLRKRTGELEIISTEEAPGTSSMKESIQVNVKRIINDDLVNESIITSSNVKLVKPDSGKKSMKIRNAKELIEPSSTLESINHSSMGESLKDTSVKVSQNKGSIKETSKGIRKKKSQKDTTAKEPLKFSNAKRSIKGSRIKKSVKGSRTKAKVKTNRVKKSLESINKKNSMKGKSVVKEMPHIVEEPLQNSSVEELLRSNTVEVSLQNSSAEKSRRNDSLEDLPQNNSVEKSLRSDSLEDLPQNNSVEKSLRNDSLEESLQNKRKEETVNVGSSNKSIMGNSTKEYYKAGSVRKSIKCSGDKHLLNGGCAKKSAETNSGKIIKSANNARLSQNSTRTVIEGETKHSKYIRKRKLSLGERRDSDEKIGLPNRKRLFNIEEDMNSDNIICRVNMETVQTCHIKSKRHIKMSSFGKFLKSFKEKSQNLNNLARSKNGSDIKMFYKLTKRKIKVKISKCGEKVTSHKKAAMPTKVEKLRVDKSFANRQLLHVSTETTSVKTKAKKRKKCMDSLRRQNYLHTIDECTAKTNNYFHKKVQKRELQKKRIDKHKPKNSNKGKRKKKHDVMCDSEDIKMYGESLPEMKNVSSNNKSDHVNLDFPEKSNLCETKYAKLLPYQNTPKTAVTFSSTSTNCNINVSCKNDPGNDRKRKNSCKENRFNCRKKKLSSKESLSKLSLQRDFLCTDCGLQFESASSKEDHQLDCKNIAFELSIMADEKLFECPYCQLTFAKEGTQKKHTSSCRVRKPRKSHKINNRLVESEVPKSSEKIVSEKMPVDLINIASRFNSYCLAHATAPQVCSVLYSCGLSTIELRNCLSDSISLENSTLVQPRLDATSTNKRNFSILKLLLDQSECSDLADILYKVMLSIKANSYIRMKDLDKPPINKTDIPPLVIESSRPDLLKALSGIEEYLKEAEDLENSAQKEEMLRNMKLAFEAGTCS